MSDENLLLQVVMDPERLRNEYTRLKEATEAAKAVVATAGDVTQIQSMRTEAHRAAEHAQRELADARAKAALTVKSAQEQAEGILMAARADAEALHTQAQAALSNAKMKFDAAEASRERARVDADSATAEMAARLKAAQDREHVAALAQAEAEKAKQEHENELARIRRIMALTKEAAGV